jgi:hypothetical protein
MCLIVFAVFLALCVNSYISGDFVNMAVYGAIAVVFGLLFGYRIYKNRKCIFGKCEK